LQQHKQENFVFEVRQLQAKHYIAVFLLFSVNFTAELLKLFSMRPLWWIA